MPVIVNLPKPKKTELVNHLLTEQSGHGALDAYQGAVLASQVNQISVRTEELQRKMGVRYDVKLEGSEALFYPCEIICPLEETAVIITRQMHEDATWEGGLRAKFRFGVSLSETYPKMETVDYYIIDKKGFLAGIEHYTNTNPILYLRGNHTYHFVINSATPPTVYYEKTQIEGHSIEPRTTIDEALKQSVYPVQGKFLANPIYGMVLTNELLSKENMQVNRLTLQTGIYLLTSQIEFTTSFDHGVVHWIKSGDGTNLAINRGTGLSGGGTTPTAIYKANTQCTIYSCVFQASNSNQKLAKNTLTALRMA